MVGVIKYAGECAICLHQDERRITRMLLETRRTGPVLQHYLELTHRDLNQHVLQCMLDKGEERSGDAA